MIRNLILLLALIIAANAFGVDNTPTTFPENNQLYPVEYTAVDGELEFNRVIDLVYKYYAPVVSKQGKRLVIERNWSDPTVNAYAYHKGSQLRIAMFGGLARHPKVTADGFMMVVCHELGHHIGGAPMIPNGWASNEGQSDYWAANKCFKYVLGKHLDSEDYKAPPQPLRCDMYKWLSKNWKECRRDLKRAKRSWRRDCKQKYPRTFRDYKARHRCYKEFNQPIEYLATYEVINKKCKLYPDRKDQIICDRTVEAGKSTAALFADLRGIRTPSIHTPSTRQVSATYHKHPHPQCRLDTYYQGALCDKLPTDYVSKYDPRRGFCNRSDNYTYGPRPRCWYMP